MESSKVTLSLVLKLQWTAFVSYILTITSKQFQKADANLDFKVMCQGKPIYYQSVGCSQQIAKFGLE